MKIRYVLAVASLALFAGCATPPAKSPNTQQIVSSLEPAAIVAVANAGVGVAVSKGIPAQQIVIVASQLKQFVDGRTISVGAMTTEIQAIEQKANLNADEVVAIAGVRAAVDTLIASYISNGVIAPSATTTIDAFLSDVIVAAEMLGAPAPAVAPGTLAAPTAEVGPPAPSSAAWKALESPQVVGASTSTIIVAGLQAWGHIAISAPTVAAITVLATFLAGWLSSL